jgi:hypothetical protein
MRGNKQKDPGAEKDGAKDQSRQNLPSAAAGLGMGLFISADACGRRVINQPSTTPPR